jgi:hypothetical protein
MYDETKLEEFGFSAFREILNEVDVTRRKPTRPRNLVCAARKPISAVKIRSVENLNRHVDHIIKSEKATRIRREAKALVLKQYEGARPEPQRNAANRHTQRGKENRDPTPKGHRRVTLPDGRKICIPAGV